MKLFETDPKTLIIFVIFGVVALMILGTLSTGIGAWTGLLQGTNSAPCSTYSAIGVSNCTAYGSNNTAITLIAGVVVPIIFFIAIVLKLM